MKHSIALLDAQHPADYVSVLTAYLLTPDEVFVECTAAHTDMADTVLRPDLFYATLDLRQALDALYLSAPGTLGGALTAYQEAAFDLNVAVGAPVAALFDTWYVRSLGLHGLRLPHASSGHARAEARRLNALDRVHAGAASSRPRTR